MFYTLQALDIITTHRGLSKSSRIKELNPILGERPSLSQLILFKYVAINAINPKQLNTTELKEFNYLSGLIVLNNHNVFNSVN